VNVIRVLRKCYYCGIKESPLQSIIEQRKLSYGEETLKYRQLILDENPEIQRYQTKIHEGVVPSNLTKYGKCITINDGLTYILDKESKRKKLNTPVKENFCKNLFQTPKSNQNEEMTLRTMKFKWKYVVHQLPIF
jgi:predicted transcriptional regulator